MACFNNEQYQILANDLIGDIFIHQHLIEEKFPL